MNDLIFFINLESNVSNSISDRSLLRKQEISMKLDPEILETWCVIKVVSQISGKEMGNGAQKIGLLCAKIKLDPYLIPNKTK